MIKCDTCGSKAKEVIVREPGIWDNVSPVWWNMDSFSSHVICPLRSEEWHRVISTKIYNIRSWIRHHYSTISKKERMIEDPAWPASIKRELKQEIKELYQKISELKKEVQIEKKLGRQKRLDHNK